MRTIIFLLCALALLVYWDLRIKLLLLFSYRGARQYVDRRVSAMARQLLKLAQFYTGLTVDLDGKPADPLPEQFLIVANHQSLADIVALFAAFPHHQVRFVAKRELRHWFPAVSWVLRLQRHALIDRHANFSRTMTDLARLAKRAKMRVCPAIFPEGTRSRTGEVQQFHAGAVRKILQTARMPVLSVAIDGGYRFSTLRDVQGNISQAHYRVQALSLYAPPATKEEITRVLLKAREEIAAQIQRWRLKE